MNMKIAHLILAHEDPELNARAIRKLCAFSDVYVHIDANTDIDAFRFKVQDVANCFFISKRLHCEWGGWNAVVAEIELLREALKNRSYDRLVFLQGRDYPIKSNDYIQRFFDEHPRVEFIRGCNCSISVNKYFRVKCRQYWFMNNMNLIKGKINSFMFEHQVELRSGYIHSEGREYAVYWGSAQWALTRECAQWVVDFFDSHNQFNKWFYHCFPADELYFTTVIMNSKWSQVTSAKGPEPEKEKLVNWRNLHYFEYPRMIKVFTADDYELLRDRPELYCRKVTSKESMELLELFDMTNS